MGSQKQAAAQVPQSRRRIRVGHDPARRRVLVSGYYGHGNAGDEAILATLVQELRSARPNVELVVVSPNPARTTAEHGLPAVPMSDLARLVEAVREADLLVLGGGGLFQDYWDVSEDTLLTPNVQGLPYYVSLPVLGALTGTPTAMYAVGVGPLLTERGRRLTRIAVDLCQLVTLRDQASVDLLRDVGVLGQQEFELVADPCFLFAPAAADRVVAFRGEIGADDSHPLLGVCLRFWQFQIEPARWQDEVARALDRFIEQTGGRLLFLPCQVEETTLYEDDVAVAKDIWGRMAERRRAIVVDHSLDPALLQGVIGRCDLVLAMRFHTTLFALKAGVPVACLAYDPKAQALMADAGLGDLALGVADWNAEAIVDALRRAPEAMSRIDSGVFVRTMTARARRATDLLVACLDRARDEEIPETHRFLHDVALGKTIAAARLEAELAAHVDATTRLREDLDQQTKAARDHAMRITELDRDLSRAIALADAQRRAREDTLQDLEESQRRHGALQADMDGLRRELDESRSIVVRLEDLGRNAVAESRALRFELSLLRRSLAVRTVFFFWKVLDRLLPVGSRRRSIYGRIRTWLTHLRSAPAIEPRSEPLEPLPSENRQRKAEVLREVRAGVRRLEERASARDANTALTILSGTALIEGEGQRPTQLALELAGRGVPVVFAYFRWNVDEPVEQDRLDDGILKIPLDVLLEERALVVGSFAGLTRVALFEFPHPQLFEAVAEFNTAGWITVYDVLDNWAQFHRVGQAVWYDEKFERHLITATDAVFAVNDTLAQHVRDLGGDWVEVVPNGFTSGVDAIEQSRPLERGQVTVGYFGYLSGAWFDWELLARAATLQPTWRFYVIGYGGGPDGLDLSDNVTLLGRRPRHELAAYASNWDVAMVPFKPGALAACADPIKTYEYLAMGLPVVLTGVPPPPNGEALAVSAHGAEEFVRKIALAAESPLEERAKRRAFASACTWSSRVDQMLGAIREERQRIAEKRSILPG